MFENNLKEIKKQNSKVSERERKRKKERKMLLMENIYMFYAWYLKPSIIFTLFNIFSLTFVYFFGSPEINLFMFLLLKLLNSCKLCVYINTRHIFGNKMHAQNL